MTFHKRRFSLIKPRLIKRLPPVWWQKKFMPRMPFMIFLLWFHFFVLFFGIRSSLILLEKSSFLVDPSDIAISDMHYANWAPAVSFNGSHYLVIWVEDQDTVKYLKGNRISPLGKACDSLPLTISRVVHNGYLPYVTSNGKDWCVVWMDSAETTDLDVYCARVSSDGALLDSQYIQLTRTPGDQIAAGIASIEQNYLIIWTYETGQMHGISGKRLSPSGKILDKSSIKIVSSSDAEYHAVIDTDGDTYMVVWCETRKGGSRICTRRVHQNGYVLSSRHDVIVEKVPQHHLYLTDVAYGNNMYLVLWEGDIDIENYGGNAVLARRITNTGHAIDTADIVISSDIEFLAFKNSSAAFGDSNFLVVWSDYLISRYMKSDLYGVRISMNGVIIDTTAIPITAIKNRQGLPDVAFDGTNYFIVWVDARKRRRARQIYGTRITADGILLDKRPMPSFDDLKKRRLGNIDARH